MARTPGDLTDTDIGFLTDRHLGTLTTLRGDGSPHVVAIAFTFDPGAAMVRMISNEGGQKIRNIERDDRATVCQVDGRRWLALEGRARVVRDADRIAAAEAAFESRYRPVRENPHRIAIELTVERVLGRS